METPTRTGSRRISRIKRCQRNATSSQKYSSVTDIVKDFEKTTNHSQTTKDEENDDDLPPTQAFQPCSTLKKDGEVYWDSHSPTFDDLRRKLSECESPAIRKSLSPLRVFTPLARLKSSKTSNESPKIDDEDLSLLKDLKELNNFEEDSSADDTIVDNQKDNVFSSDDDFFLVQATQIPAEPQVSEKADSRQPSNLDSNQNPREKIQRIAQQTSRTPPPPAANAGDDLDFDDDMDLLMSQIEMPVEVSKASSTSTTTKIMDLQQVRNPSHKPIVADLPLRKEETVLKKRFKSAENIKSSQSASIMKTWRRSNTSPEASTSSAALPGARTTIPSKCTKEEIERKRQEAIKRRKEKCKQFKKS